MTPIKTNESNFTYLGPTSEIADLPCRTEGTDTYSVWEPTPEERKLFAEGGHIRLGIHSTRPIPPVSLQVVANAGPFERVPAPCDVCGDEAEASAHDAGPGTHAYRSRAGSPTKPKPKTEVYNRPECIFNYCPYTQPTCAEGGCQHPVNKGKS